MLSVELKWVRNFGEGLKTIKYAAINIAYNVKEIDNLISKIENVGKSEKNNGHNTSLKK